MSSCHMPKLFDQQRQQHPSINVIWTQICDVSELKNFLELKSDQKYQVSLAPLAKLEVRYIDGFQIFHYFVD